MFPEASILRPSPSHSRELRSAARDVLAARDEDLHFIRPASGLSADYLNLISAFVMMLQLAPEDEEVRRELEAWRPVGYREHYAASPLPQAREAIERYDRMPEAQRRTFEALLDAMHDLAAVTLRALSRCRDADEAADIAATAAQSLGLLIDVVGRYVNHGDPPDLRAARAQSAAAMAALREA